MESIRAAELALHEPGETDELALSGLWKGDRFTEYIQVYALPEEVNQAAVSDLATEVTQPKSREMPVVQRIPLAGWK